mmetsp:Transcript_14500/g.25724  ORF Transcript_14500/g.25724 Transcript_14500/m.25724 type:complete len:221 (-) Transcript_14500:1927-2589(-)
MRVGSHSSLSCWLLRGRAIQERGRGMTMKQCRTEVHAMGQVHTVQLAMPPPRDQRGATHPATGLACRVSPRDDRQEAQTKERTGRKEGKEGKERKYLRGAPSLGSAGATVLGVGCGGIEAYVPSAPSHSAHFFFFFLSSFSSFFSSWTSGAGSPAFSRSSRSRSAIRFFSCASWYAVSWSCICVRNVTRKSPATSLCRWQTASKWAVIWYMTSSMMWRAS